MNPDHQPDTCSIQVFYGTRDWEYIELAHHLFLVCYWRRNRRNLWDLWKDVASSVLSPDLPSWVLEELLQWIQSRSYWCLQWKLWIADSTSDEQKSCDNCASEEIRLRTVGTVWPISVYITKHFSGLRLVGKALATFIFAFQRHLEWWNLNWTSLVWDAVWTIMSLHDGPLTIRLCKKHFKTKYTQGCYAFNQQCLDSSGT